MEVRMNKSVIEILASRLVEKHRLTQDAAEKFVRQMFETANVGLAEEKLVKIKGLGTFKVTSVKDRESINVNTGERILIEGRDKINFTPDNILKEIVNKPFAQFETVVINDGVDFQPIDDKYKGGLAPEIPIEPKPVAEPIERPVEEQTEEPAKPIEESVEQPIVKSTEDKDVVIPCEEVTAKIEPEVEAKPITEISKPANESIVEIAEPVNEPIDETIAGPTSESIAKPTSEPKNVIPSNKKVEDTEHDIESISVTSNVSATSGIPRQIYWMCGIALLLIVGSFGFLLYNYNAQSQRLAELEIQLAKNNHSVAQKAATKAKTNAQSVATSAIDPKVLEKAKVDSIRLLREHEALVAATQKANEAKVPTGEAKQKTTESVTKGVAANAKATMAQEVATSKYDADPRVRTGAYSIIGVEQTIKAKKGQTLASISRTYLGSGMECYLEALNGNGPIKEGQSVKIPKLKLKKKK
jgi:nucleoid DNA-binding protein